MLREIMEMCGQLAIVADQRAGAVGSGHELVIDQRISQRLITAGHIQRFAQRPRRHHRKAQCAIFDRAIAQPDIIPRIGVVRGDFGETLLQQQLILRE